MVINFNGRLVMSRAEEFIREHTRNCSNVSKVYRSKGLSMLSYCVPWLTPDQARKAVEIAREEVKEKAIKWVEENAAKYLVTRSVNGVKMTGLDASIGDDFKKYMEG